MFCRSVVLSYYESLIGEVLPAIAHENQYPVTSSSSLAALIAAEVTGNRAILRLKSAAVAELDDDQLERAVEIAEQLAEGDLKYWRELYAHTTDLHQASSMRVER